MSGHDPNAGSSEWWTTFFDDRYAELDLVRPDAAAVQGTVEFLVEKLCLEPGGRLFDQCCGVGRLSIPIARRHVQVVGVDLAESYIERARDQAKAQQLSCEFQVADAFDFVPPVPCDAAINWYTSFGYTNDDRRNVLMLRRAFDALRPGGRFALETINLPRVLREFKDCIISRAETEAGETLVVRETQLDIELGMFNQRWTFITPEGHRAVKHGATKMYLPHTLRDMLAACGFAEVKLFGSTSGEPLAIDSPRCICVGVKPHESRTQGE